MPTAPTAATPSQDWPAPWFTADIVLVSQGHGLDSRVLLVRRASDSDAFPDYWALPGGFVEPGETSLAAAVRELAEETGIEIGQDRLRLVAIGDAPHRDPRHWTVSAVYAAVIGELPVPVAADDAAEAEWIPLEQALDAWLAFDHRHLLQQAVATLR